VFALSARHVLPIDAPPLRDASVIIDGDRIVDVVPGVKSADATFLNDAVILPGLVNAHTHLEFSDLTAPLGTACGRFSDWVAEVIHWRRSRDTDPISAANWRTAAIQRGLAESVRSGVTTVGDIATAPFSAAGYAATSGLVVAFAECLGLTRWRAEGQEAVVRQHLGDKRLARPDVVWGVSPHATYTVRRDLLDRLCAWSAAERLPLAMHVAESREELQLLDAGTGPLRELLGELNAWDATAIKAGTGPSDYLQQLALAHRAIVIHGNYLTSDDVEFLAQRRDRMAVVFCPRTHQYGGHGTYPLWQMLAAGVTLALGTDSRATSANLDLFEDMRLVARQFEYISPETIVRLATMGGASALGCADRVGSLSAGKRADLVVVRLSESGGGDPYAFLRDPRCHVQQVYQAGQLVFTSGSC
jgi:cytosine/adenosine deaminase-related metal-dependent hydrolase